MNKYIENLIQNYVSCIKFQRENTKQLLMLREVPGGPWQSIGLDIFHFRDSKWLLVIDYFNKYAEVAELKNIASPMIISALKSSFARFGIPKIVYSDNETQLDSIDLKEFVKAWNFTRLTSRPKYPESNGMAERRIGIVKNISKNIKYEHKDPWLALLEYRNTPI